MRYTPYLFIVPFFLIFGVFGLWPLLYTAYISFFKWDFIGGDQGFVGLEQYQRLLADPFFWNALGNTIILFVLATVPQLLLALWIAWMLDRKLRAASFWRSGVLLPNIVAATAVAIIFAQIFSKESGPVNWVLGWFGIGPIDFQAQRLPALIAIAVIVIWRYTGYNTLLYLAAMQSVPREIYEAAAIDGANRWRVFWSVTIPQIRPTLIFTIIMSTIGGLQLFTEPALFSDRGLGSTGGSDRQFQTLLMYFYEKGFVQFNAGYAAAIAWVLFLIIAVIAAVNLMLTRRISRS